MCWEVFSFSILRYHFILSLLLFYFFFLLRNQPMVYVILSKVIYLFKGLPFVFVFQQFDHNAFGVVLFIIIFLGVCSISWCFGHLGKIFGSTILSNIVFALFSSLIVGTFTMSLVSFMFISVFFPFDSPCSGYVFF